MRVSFLFRQGHNCAAALVIVVLGWTSYSGADIQPTKQALVKVAVESKPSPTPSLSPTPTPKGTVAGAQTKLAPKTVQPGGISLIGRNLYLEPGSRAAEQAAAWRAARPADAARMDKLASRPQARWIGDWMPQPQAEVRRLVGAAQTAGSIPVMVIYSLPGRDCGGYSAGGAGSIAAYQAWVNQIVAGIGGRPAAVILEPDALPELDCFSATQQSALTGLMSWMVERFKSSSNTLVYLDAGHSGWQPANVMAVRLKAAGVARADGFSLNVSNFMTTGESVAYGNKISGLVGGKHYVVDTSRNGTGYGDTWCNPVGRALGAVPTTRTGSPLVDAYLWIKAPGESDGTCNGGPTAGEWWPEYALDLAQRAGY